MSQVANDFGIFEGTLSNWLKRGLTDAERVELRETTGRIRLLEQENEVLVRAAAYLSQANLPGK